MKHLKHASNVTVYGLAAIWVASPIVLLVQIIERQSA
jgi:hypothetical protein